MTAAKMRNPVVHRYHQHAQSPGRLALGGGLLALLLALCQACSPLLPKIDTQSETHWTSFEAARGAFDEITPYQTRVPQLNTLGFDPFSNPNITILTYSDVIRRFVPNPQISMQNLDRGVSECIAAHEACRAYEIDVRSIKRQRIGNFWADFLNFKRHTEVAGWRFNGLIVINGDLVVYKLWGGQPLIKEREEARNPLGPLQSMGESSVGRLLP